MLRDRTDRALKSHGKHTTKGAGKPPGMFCTKPDQAVYFGTGQWTLGSWESNGGSGGK